MGWVFERHVGMLQVLVLVFERRMEDGDMRRVLVQGHCRWGVVLGVCLFGMTSS